MARKTMWIKVVLVSAAVIILTLLSGPGQSASLYAQDAESSWPYIYYPGSGGWIIEHADGADRHVLGQGVGCGMIVDHTWSPSGRWLLWECGSDNPPAAGSKWRAVRADNNRTVTLLEQFASTELGVLWSPLGDDTLLVYSQSTPDFINSERVWGPGVYLIDAEQDTVIWYHELSKAYLSFTMSWSPDGRYILLPDSGFALIVPSDGSEPIERNDLGSSVQWLSDGRLLYFPSDSDQLVIEDLTTAEKIVLPFTDESTLSSIWWNYAGNQALLFAQKQLWWLALDKADGPQLELVSEQIVSPFFNGWSVQNPMTTTFDGYIWSPDDRGALVATEDGTLYWLDAATGALIPTPLPPSDKRVVVQAIQWGGPYGFVLWNNQYFVYEYATNSLVDTLIFEPTGHARYRDTPLNIAVSSNGRYLAYTWGVYGYSVIDWQADTEIQVMPNPTLDEIDRMFYGDAKWLPGRDLVFAAEQTSFPPTTMHHWSILAADGQLNRPLFAHIIIEPHVLPDTVDRSLVAQLPLSPSNEPALAFQAHDWWTGQLAWSPDGHYLVTAETYDYGDLQPGSMGGDPVRVWDATSGDLVSELPLGGCAAGAVSAGEKTSGAFLSARSQTGVLSGYPEDLAWVPNSNLVAMTLTGCWGTRNQLLFWDYMSGDIVAAYEGVRAFAFSADGSQLALGYRDSNVVSVQPYPLTGEEITHLTLNASARYLLFSPDDSRLAAVARATYEGPQDELSIWDLAQPDQPLFPPIPTESLKSLSFSGDGTTLAVTVLPVRCFESTPPRMIEVATGKNLTEPNESIRIASYSPDGRYLATSGCGTRIWKADTLEPLVQYPQIGLALAWSPDGTQLAAGASYGVFIWDLPLLPGSTAIVHVIDDDTLNVRSATSLNAAILAELADGAAVVLLEGPVETEGFSWWRVRTADGIEGWAVESADGVQTLSHE